MKMDNGQLVPELRFPEFEKKWLLRKLGELGDFKGGGTPSSSKKSYWQGDIPWVSSSDISDESIHTITTSRFINETAIKESATKLIPAKSILMVSRVGIGKFAITDNRICTSQDFTNLTPNQNYVFLAYLFKSRANRFVRFSQGTSIKGFTSKDIKSLKFRIPESFNEQQKIANFLTAIDQRITLLKQKKAALEDYKKGLMQRIFSQEIRFKDDEGNDFPDWEKKKLGDFVSLSKRKYNPKDSKDSLPCIELDCIDQNTGFLLKQYDSKSQKSIKTYFEKGNILFGKLRPYLRKFYRAEFDGVCSTEIWVLKTKKLVEEFLYYLVQTERFSFEVNLTTGTRMPRADWKLVSSAKIKIPSKKEQQKIANFLSATDKKITTMDKQITDSELFKNGLLQRMFV